MAENILANAASTLEPEQKIFKPALFGFKRDDVLTYISSLNKASSDIAKELNGSIEQLENRLFAARNDNQELTLTVNKLETLVQQETASAEAFKEQVQALRLDIDRANDEAAAYKSRLFAASQEVTVLKADNTRLNSSINLLTSTVAQYEAQREEEAQKAKAALLEVKEIKQRAIEDAKNIRDKASNDVVGLIAAAEHEKNEAKKAITVSAQSIAMSVSNIKSQMSAVDAKIASAISELNGITGSIANTLNATEDNLSALGVQLTCFPEPATPVKATPARHNIVQRQKKPDRVSEGILGMLAKLLR